MQDKFLKNQYTDMMREFLALETAGGILLVTATIFAMGLANSDFASTYTAFLDIPVAIKFGTVEIAKPLLLWINDGLMAVFFFLIGLEIKREFLAGELASFSQIALPGIGAIGGVVLPALIYIYVNQGSPENLSGWAIPAATDIAFALAVLSLLGDRVPVALKILLLAIAIFDDLGAILIIAFFYTDQLSVNILLLAPSAVRRTCVVELERRYPNRAIYCAWDYFMGAGVKIWCACNFGRGGNSLRHTNDLAGRGVKGIAGGA